MRRPYVIAEAAGCHDLALDRALSLVDLAKAVGADAVKFQWVSSPERLAERRRALDYLGAYCGLAFPRAWFAPLVARCRAAPPIDFLCTTYLPEDIAVVAPYVPRFKIASFEAGDPTFLVAHLPFGKPIVISTGLMDASAVAALVRDLEALRGARFSLLHCVSAYPAPPASMNLRCLFERGPRGRRFSGLSDHSKHPITGALAVACGATIVEFHVRLDDTAPTNPDFEVARTPAEAALYVQNIRDAEAMLGDGVKRVTNAERPFERYRVR